MGGRFRLSACLFILFSQGICVQLLSQSNTEKVNINYTNLILSDILDSLSGKFNINFSYNASLPTFKELKSISCNTGLEDILKILLYDEALEYNIIGKQVIIFPTSNAANNYSLYKKDNNFVIVRGIISDKKNHEPLSFASIAIKNKSIGTVSNNNGEFILTIPDSLSHNIIEFSFLGYKPEYRLIDSVLDKPVNIGLAEDVVSILEIVVKPILGLEIIKEVINNINNNYSNKNAMYTAFYRESTREGNDYISVCEAVLDIAKAPYNNPYMNDQAKIFKERKSENVKRIKNLSYKLEGGVYNCIRLDVVKDIATFLSSEYFDSYDYQYIKKMTYDNREIMVVEFNQKKGILLPLYKGTMYIDEETKALVGVNFSLSPYGIKYSQNYLIKKQPSKSQVKPVGADYKIFYRYTNGTWYPAYMRAELRVKAKSEKLFFNSLFTSITEMAVTEIDTTNNKRFRGNEVLKSQDIMADKTSGYDENFWSGYNIIQPETPIIEAIGKLNIKKDTVLKEKVKVWDKLF